MMRSLTNLLSGFVILCTLASCDTERLFGRSEDYDTLFLGFSLGMGRKEFYDYCWQKNKERMFTHGPTNQMVQYKLIGELDQPVYMRFYPYFYEDKISEMDVTFDYEAWAPWNRQYSADTLLKKMLPVFEKWYGEGFKVAETKRRGTVYYRRDGYRRITLFRKDDQYVEAIFTDVRDEKEWKNKMGIESD
jgi:hypothetical protein